MEETQPEEQPIIRVTVNPGICGFPCSIEGEKKDKYRVALRGLGSECKHVQRLFEQVQEMGLRDLFAPISKSPVFQAAQQSGCHPMCPVPIAILKTAEATMGMALPRDAEIKFER
ncbi:MAG: hypothetical protein MUF69_14740 [Desulfobacterota bacterium]|jgi:hypothetical protein|nr:hypothetical protein [Thermodesulfobacteriota bacterium]